MINNIPWWHIALWAIASLFYLNLAAWVITAGILSAILDKFGKAIELWNKTIDRESKTIPFRERGL